MSETQPCALCRGLFPPARLVTVDGRAVCAGCKPVLLQRLLSGAPEPLVPLDFDGRELGFGEMTGAAWRVFRGEWTRLVPLVAGISLLGSGVVQLFGFEELETGGEMLQSLGLVSAVDLILGVIAPLGGTWLVRERLAGRRGSLGLALAHSRRRWLAGVGTGGLEFVLLLAALLLLVVPAVILTGYFTFSTIAVSLRGLSGPAALRYSMTLVTGRWWRVFGYAMALLAPLFAVILTSIVAGALGLESPDWIENLLIDLATLPALLGLTVLYLHLDTQQRAREGAAGPTPSASAGRG